MKINVKYSLPVIAECTKRLCLTKLKVYYINSCHQYFIRLQNNVSGFLQTNLKIAMIVRDSNFSVLFGKGINGALLIDLGGKLLFTP
jgi:hypothetical protein